MSGVSLLLGMMVAGAALDPVAEWTFDRDDGPGLRVIDSSASQLEGRVHGARWVEQGSGLALAFDGGDRHVDMGAPPELDITGAVTLEAWVFPRRIPDSEVGIAGKSIGSYGLTYYTDGACYWYIGGGGNKRSAALPTGRWTHIAATFDGARMALYLNGALADAGASEFAEIRRDTTFQLGRIRREVHPAPNTSGFDGLLGGVRVYDRALSAEDILARFESEAEGYQVSARSDALAVSVYPYPDEGRIYVDVDGSMLFPKPIEAAASLVWRRMPDKTVLAEKSLEVAHDAPIIEDIAFDAAEIPPGEYELVATLFEKGRVRSTQRVPFEVFAPGAPPSPRDHIAPALTAGLPRRRDAFVTEVFPGGGFTVATGSAVFAVESSFSFPHGGENRLRAVSEIDTAGEPEWTVTTESPREHRISATGAHYALERTLRVLPGRVHVTDTFTNRTDTVLGIVISNHFASSGHAVTAGLPPNGTVFVQVDGAGAGMAPLDDVYLEQHETFHGDGAAGLRNERFGLDARASATLEWVVYVNDTGDYYDFINDIRNDEGLIRRVEGSFSFIPRDEAPTAEYVRNRGLAYASVFYLSKPLDDPNSSLEGIEYVEFPEESRRLRDTFALIREAFPELRTMFHIAHSLYATNRPMELFPDSRTIDAGGNQTMYGGDNPDYYAKYFSREYVDAGYRWYIFYPASDNGFGRAMLHAIDYMLDEIGCLNMYADGFTHGYGGRFTYDRWDGHTVEIDPDTRTVRRQYASVNLMGQDVMVEIARRIQARGGVVIANSYMGTRSVYRENVLYCLETASGDATVARLYLTPSVIGFGNPDRCKTPRAVHQDILAKLEYGALYFFYGDPELPYPMVTTGMFPITPVDIRPGVVTGPERIVTSRSGVYGLPGARALHRARLWDGRGREVAHRFATTADAQGVRTELQLGPSQCAVVEFLPVDLETDAPVNVAAHRCGPEGVLLDLNGVGSARLVFKEDTPSGGAPVLSGAGELRRVEKTPAGLALEIRLEGPTTLELTPAAPAP